MHYKCAFNYVNATLNKEKKGKILVQTCVLKGACLLFILSLHALNANLWLINTFSLILVGFVYEVNQVI